MYRGHCGGYHAPILFRFKHNLPEIIESDLCIEDVVQPWPLKHNLLNIQNSRETRRFRSDANTSYNHRESQVTVSSSNSVGRVFTPSGLFRNYPTYTDLGFSAIRNHFRWIRSPLVETVQLIRDNTNSNFLTR